MVVSRERASRRASEAVRTTPPAVPVVLSQQVGGVESEHWSGAMYGQAIFGNLANFEFHYPIYRKGMMFITKNRLTLHVFNYSSQYATGHSCNY